MAKIVVNEDNKKGLENDEGKEIMPCEYDNIEEFGCYDIFKVIKNGKEGIYDLDIDIVRMWKRKVKKK